MDDHRNHSIGSDVGNVTQNEEISKNRSHQEVNINDALGYSEVVIFYIEIIGANFLFIGEYWKE